MLKMPAVAYNKYGRDENYPHGLSASCFKLFQMEK